MGAKAECGHDLRGSGSKWLRSEGAHADADEIEEQQKTVEGIVNPIFAKLYGAGGRGGGGAEEEEESMDDHDEL